MRFILSFVLFQFIFLYSPCQLVINEFLAGNVSGLMDEDNDYSDWIEIYNSGTEVVDLSNYALSDDILLPGKWTFPALQMGGGQHVLVFASGKDRKNVDLAYQTLIDWGDEWSYIVPESQPEPSWREPGYDDSSWDRGVSGFGYSDGDDATLLGTTISVFIRKEFDLQDADAVRRLFLDIDYDDGFIAYINGTEVIRANLGVPGDPVDFDRAADGDHEAAMYQGGAPERFEIEDLAGILLEGTNVLAIEGHNKALSSSDFSLIPFLTIATVGGTDQISPHLSYNTSGGLHTNFKIKADGESFYLYDASGIMLDSVGAIPLPIDISFGRKPDGTSSWLYFAEPTPGKANTTAGATEAEANHVIFSPKGGKHLGGTSISLSTADPADPIYYTTDGSVPTTSSILYSGPITIPGDGVIRARVIKTGTLPGPITTNTYVTQYNHQIPVVCISTNPENLWDDEIGIYVLGNDYETSMPHYGANYWEEWERPVHLELYEPSGEKMLDQGAGMKIFGGWSRTNEQKSVALFARKDYGKGSFEYSLFPNKSIDEFEAFVLRNSGNDNMQLQFHDAFMTGLTRDMNTDYQASRPAAVYLNGEYWGIENIREKVNEHFVAGNHHVDPDDVNLLEYASSIIHGTNEQYLDILSFLNGHPTLANDDDYIWVRDQIDLDNYIQYQLTQIYLNNTDWPGNNIKFWNTNSGMKWRWILFDTDFGFMPAEYGENTLAFALVPNGTSWPNPSWSTLFFRRMISNPEFRLDFITQFCDRLNVDFRSNRVQADLDSMKNLYYHDMQYHFNRWWGSYSQWEERISGRKVFGYYRPQRVRIHMRDQFNLEEELEVGLDVSDENAGKIQINTVSPDEYPFTGIYFKNIPIKLTAVPKPGYKFVRWEGTLSSNQVVMEYDMSDDASFTAVFEEAATEDISIVINEINYSSSDSWDTRDWVEFVNNGNTTVDMEGWLFSDSGPDTGYYFRAGIVLPPGAYLVLCRDLADFRSLNPNVFNSIGDMPFGLSTGGENLRLYDPEGYIMDAVNYSPYTPWPENATGTGMTLELIDPSLDNMQGENWQAISFGGTPGRNNNGYDAIGHEDLPALLTAFECFPNPFTDFTTIRFTVSEPGTYRLEVFDIKGQLIDVLADEYLIPDTYSIDWHGSGSGGNEALQGIYTIRLSSETQYETIKLVRIN